ncbi:hypothetical protein FB106_11632 [Synechococcus sp. Ace-Pa]|nr:hypothetical protein BM449_11605 [Synechococcus sp. SynAce01]TWB88583.1 hypothetical protein FB106_11632 [Synechococcus sp. Ace-Pa]
MDHASLQRHLSPLVHWAISRMAQLDAEQRYEESFALSEEFRDWIVCLDDHAERLDVLITPFRTPFDPKQPRKCSDGAGTFQRTEQQAAD